MEGDRGGCVISVRRSRGEDRTHEEIHETLMSLNEREILDGLQQFGCLLHFVLDLLGQRDLGWVTAGRSLIPEGDQGRQTEPALKRELPGRQAFAP
jgi:hypothetical protein